MHSDLIAKLEALEGPNWAVEKEIAVTIDREQWLDRERLNLPFPNYTASLDAAIALVERVLPGWFWRCGKTILFPKGWAYVSKTHPSHCDREDEASCADGRAANPAIALLIAALKALEARDG